MTENLGVQKIQPKRFTDRKDISEIINSSGNFRSRGHEQVPGWMVGIFFLTQAVFIMLMIYFSAMLVRNMQQQTEIISVVKYMLAVFIIVTAYSLFIVKRLKKCLSATEFMSLFLAKSLESYSSCFALINKQGKIIYFNENFAKEYLSSGDVENLNYEDALNREFFSEKYLGVLKESLENNKENSFSMVSSTSNSQTMRNIKIVPLSRPEGVFVLKVITVKIIKGAKQD